MHRLQLVLAVNLPAMKFHHCPDAQLAKQREGDNAHNNGERDSVYSRLAVLGAKQL